ncbi:MAG: DUF3109 family protein [Bacteroidales bacterium]|nr:DUF3109 family protein [Bacteroidales bacterium]
MILDNVLIPDNLKDVFFLCDLQQCQGACCVEGDAGAPVEEEEVGQMEDIIDEVLPYMDEAGKEMVNTFGVYDYDASANLVTPLKPNDDCVYMVWVNNHTICLFEKLYNEGKINFIKPISCQLYPIRIIEEGAFEKWFLHKWNICHSAFLNGEHKGVHLFAALKAGIVRRYGLSFYNRLLIKCGLDPQNI